MKNDVLKGLRNVVIVAAVFLSIIGISFSENNALIVTSFTAGCAGLGYLLPKLAGKVNLKAVIGWGILGFVAGLLFAFFGV